jgi:phosphinothricin acetyltransferase
VTFEEAKISTVEMGRRINAVNLKFPWFVFERESEVLGYTYATEWKSRSAYRRTVETTIYLDHQALGKGVGKCLYSHLLAHLESQGIHTVIGGIALPNDGSIGLHESLGFKKVAHFAEVGFKFNQWVDVAYWQKYLG